VVRKASVGQPVNPLVSRGLGGLGGGRAAAPVSELFLH